MKIENNLENKAKFFAQYWGQNVLTSTYHTTKLYCINRGNIRCEKQDFLELKPVSQISDEDAINLGYGNVLHLKSNLDRNIDQLRSLGFALPWMDLSVKDLIEYGWIKIKD